MADVPETKFPFVQPAGSDAEMFIQWKNTDVCLDLYCSCGAHGHFDGYFAHYLRCVHCGTVYQLGTQVILKKFDGDPPIERLLEPDEDLITEE